VNECTQYSTVHGPGEGTLNPKEYNVMAQKAHPERTKDSVAIIVH
jgi:hypothetical protein